jgi:hypothetical protein
VRSQPSNILRTGRMSYDRTVETFGPLDPRVRLLDVAAGDSLLVHELSALGGFAVALDIDYAHGAPPSSPSVCADLLALPFPAETSTRSTPASRSCMSATVSARSVSSTSCVGAPADSA